MTEHIVNTEEVIRQSMLSDMRNILSEVFVGIASSEQIQDEGLLFLRNGMNDQKLTIGTTRGKTLALCAGLLYRATQKRIVEAEHSYRANNSVP